MGKAQKKANNLAIKMAKIKERNDKVTESHRKFMDKLNNLDDNVSVQIRMDDGSYLWNGVTMTGKAWKELFKSHY